MVDGTGEKCGSQLLPHCRKHILTSLSKGAAHFSFVLRFSEHSVEM